MTTSRTSDLDELQRLPLAHTNLSFILSMITPSLIRSLKVKSIRKHLDIGNDGFLHLDKSLLFITQAFCMKLMTKELRKKIPSLYSQEKVKDPTVYAKYFTPDSSWTWYVMEFDGKDTFFGYVDGIYPEMGYFSLSELESVTGPLGLKVERDLYWKPKPLSEVRKDVMARRGRK